jgi:hypothetical protein
MGLTSGAAACVSCDPSCGTCNDEGPTGCLTCNTGAVHTVCGGSNMGSCHCEVGTFFNGTTCTACADALCDICSSDGVTCYRCKPEAKLTSNSC